MKKINLITIILVGSSLLISCGSKPRDPLQQSISVIGAESDRRKKQKKNQEEFFERLQYQKKLDNFDKVANRRPEHPRRPGGGSPNFNFDPRRN